MNAKGCTDIHPAQVLVYTEIITFTLPSRLLWASPDTPKRQATWTTLPSVHDNRTSITHETQDRQTRDT